MTFDADRAIFKGPDQFERFRVEGPGKPLGEARLKPDEDLLVFERQGVRQALIAHQMAYHHLAQGFVASEPYLVSF